MVRAEWSERMAERRRHLDLAREFGERGRSFVELDVDGTVVRRDPAGSRGSV